MKKTVKILLVASFLIILLVACSKKTAKITNTETINNVADNIDDEDYFVPELDAPVDPFANQKQGSQEKLFNIPESPASDFSYELSEDGLGIMITKYRGGAKCHIPSEIEGMPVTEISSTTFEWNKDLVVLVIPDTVKKFSVPFCTSLKAVKLPSSISKLPPSCFLACESLEEIIIPESVTTIGRCAFSSSGLKSIYIPDTVTNIEDSVFSDCEKLSKVQLPSTLKILPESVFEKCTSLETVILPIGITKIDNRAFCDSAISSLSIPVSVTEIGYKAFEDCKLLTSLTIPDSVTTIGREAFKGAGLETLELSNSLEHIDLDLYECKSLKKIHLPDSLDYFDGNCVLYNGAETKIQSLNIPKSIKELELRGEYLKSLTELIIPDSITEIDFGSSNFQGTQLNLATQKRLRELGYKGKFTSN